MTKLERAVRPNYPIAANPILDFLVHDYGSLVMRSFIAALKIHHFRPPFDAKAYVADRYREQINRYVFNQ